MRRRRTSSTPGPTSSSRASWSASPRRDASASSATRSRRWPRRAPSTRWPTTRTGSTPARPQTYLQANADILNGRDRGCTRSRTSSTARGATRRATVDASATLTTRSSTATASSAPTSCSRASCCCPARSSQDSSRGALVDHRARRGRSGESLDPGRHLRRGREGARRARLACCRATCASAGSQRNRSS